MAIVVNNHYPIGYFAEINPDSFGPTSPEIFWASTENYPPTPEWLEFDLDRERPVNFIDFEICKKPIDIKIYYKDSSNTWVEVTPREDYNFDLRVSYGNSESNPWVYKEAYFQLVKTRYIKIEFTRLTTPFPTEDTDPFPWSIEVRNLRIIHLISERGEFEEDFGYDVLGNEYRTDIEVYDAENVVDYDTNTFWQSQPNPSRFAVEYLYFDCREGWEPNTMNYLDQFTNKTLDEWSQTQMEFHKIDGVVIDQVYVDPITYGPSMHFYYSLDEEEDFDNKLWIPIPQHYICKKGFHDLPSPTFVKFFKIEFSNLTPALYNTQEYPLPSKIRYRRYPAWVQSYFLDIYPFTRDEDKFIDPFERIKVNPIDLGFKTPQDRLDTTHGVISRRPYIEIESTEEIKRYISQNLKETAIEEVKKDSLNKVRYYATSFFQRNLTTLLDLRRSLSRFVARSSRIFTREVQIPELEPPQHQSYYDMNPIAKERHMPIMWFSRTCRHSYQILEVEHTSKIVYYVAIREVSFHRKDYTVEFDEEHYFETLEDVDHVDYNDFSEDNWKFVVTP